VYGLYWHGPRKLQSNALLFGASWFFYTYWELSFLPLLILSTSVDYMAGIKIEKAHQTNPKHAKWYLMASVVTNLGLLSVFKFAAFFKGFFPFLENFYASKHGSILLPLGISFYTFQTLSYTVDVYKKKIPACRNFIDLGLYVSFFPQLIAGPIERAKHLLTQFQIPPTQRRPDDLQLRYAAFMIFLGVFKKVAIADQIAGYSRWGITHMNLQEGWDIMLCGFVFITEFLCDFSAYTDIAIGSAMLFGVVLHENFLYPYFQSNPQSFWRNWHITLTQWFRDYVFIPMALHLKVPRWLALVITMGLVGLWHGGHVKFLYWGLSWGIVMVAYTATKKLWAMGDALRGVFVVKKLLGIGLMLFLWVYLGFFFVSQNTENALFMQKNFFNGLKSVRFEADLLHSLYYLVPFYTLEWVQWFYGRKDFVFAWKKPVRVVVFVLLLLYLLANYHHQTGEFIYFQF
jgi:D-alanyl-lipoteichoic acid acyltransferase DltB (MBOAT superfamily)